jgi:branched-chain amino acid transport system substrate-binding protein
METTMQRRAFLAAGAALGGFGLAARAAGETNGVSAGEIVIGSTGVLGGPLGSVIKSMLSGADLAFAENRAKGGVNGRSIRLVSLDDELKPEKAVENYEKLLKEHRVFAFFGCVGSGTTAAAAQVLAQSGAPMVGGYAVADSARDKVKGSAYFVRATTGREADVLVQHLTTIGITRIAVAHLDNPGGQEALHLIEKALAAHQLKPLAAAGVKGDASNAAEVAKLLSAEPPQAILMYLGGPLAGEVMKATWALGSNPTFYGMSIVPADVTAKVAGLRARGLAISQVVPFPWGEVDPVTREYRRLAEAAKVPVGYYSFEGYLNALVLLEGLRNAGRDLTRPRLHSAMRALKLRLAGMDVDFTTGSATGGRFVDLVQVSESGRFVR